MLKMLIADDEPVIIRGLQMLIDWAQLGIEICATCENGADALREIFAQSPDLALLDISMPGKTGIEILKAHQGHLYQRLSGFFLRARCPQLRRGGLSVKACQKG